MSSQHVSRCGTGTGCQRQKVSTCSRFHEAVKEWKRKLWKFLPLASVVLDVGHDARQYLKNLHTDHIYVCLPALDCLNDEQFACDGSIRVL